MKTKLLILFLCSLHSLGCDTSTVMKGKVAGGSFDQFLFQNKQVTASYKADINLVWAACEKALIDLGGNDIQKDRKIAAGKIKATVRNENVTIVVEYEAKGLTSVSVFVGAFGSNIASRLIHEKISGNLANP